MQLTGVVEPVEETWQARFAFLLPTVRDRLDKGDAAPGHPFDGWKAALYWLVAGGLPGLMKGIAPRLSRDGL